MLALTPIATSRNGGEGANDTDENETRDDDPAPSSSSSSESYAWWHGLGLFGESYLLFSVGTLRPLWEKMYPDDGGCRDSSCDALYDSVALLAVLGIAAGMIAIGALADKLGRRGGGILTSAIMCGGAACLTLTSALLVPSVDEADPSRLFRAVGLCTFVFGVGVGGEYPVSAASASERVMSSTSPSSSGRRVRRCRDERVGESVGGVGAGAEPPTPRRRGDGGTSVAIVAGNDGRGVPLLPPEMAAASATKEPKIFFSDDDDVGTNGDSLLRFGASGRKGRGREVLTVFSMQGLGIFVQASILTLLLATTRKRMTYDDDDDGSDDVVRDLDDVVADGVHYYYDRGALLNAWRATYAVGTAVLLYVFISRVLYLEESAVWIEDRRRSDQAKAKRQTEDAVRKLDIGGGDGGFVRPRQDEKEEWWRQQQGKDTAISSPTLSSLTMKSEFDLLGSTNLNGCSIIPAASVLGEVEEECDDVRGGWRMRKALSLLGISSETMLLLRHYGVRLFGTSATWLLWDVAYYGNKLFQGSFLIALTGEDTSLVAVSCASMINAFVALMGYYAAAAIVDDPDCGRLALQQTGFVITGTLFLLCGTIDDRLSSTWLVVMYFGSSFFGQCGPNCTTFLIPAELFPTNMRTMCHGISAAAGKIGAIIASVLFHYMSVRDLFLLSGCASFAAGLITFVTIPETTTLDLREIDIQWAHIVSGNGLRYEGPAIDPRHLSFYERYQNRLLCRGHPTRRARCREVV